MLVERERGLKGTGVLAEAANVLCLGDQRMIETPKHMILDGESQVAQVTRVRRLVPNLELPFSFGAELPFGAVQDGSALARSLTRRAEF